jgi:hypothetical protein
MKKNEDYENFEKGMIYKKILEKRGVVEKRGEEETKLKHTAFLISRCKCIST